MSTGEPAYDPSIGGSNPTPPVTIDGTGLTTTVPLLVKNGKSLSGIEVQVTGTAPSGLVVNDSSGVRQGAVGLAVSVSDWVANSAAGDFVITGPASAGTKKILLKNLSSGGVQILSPSSTGPANAGWLRIDDTNFTQIGYGAQNLLINTARSEFTGPMAISNSNSLTTVALEVAGDANTGIGQIGGADTLGIVAGGVEIARGGADFIISPAGALATNATTGFLRLPTCAGPPTGAATNGAIVIDTTNSKLYLRIGGAWLGGTVPGAFV